MCNATRWFYIGNKMFLVGNLAANDHKYVREVRDGYWYVGRLTLDAMHIIARDRNWAIEIPLCSDTDSFIS